MGKCEEKKRKSHKLKCDGKELQASNWRSVRCRVVHKKTKWEMQN